MFDELSSIFAVRITAACRLRRNYKPRYIQFYLAFALFVFCKATAAPEIIRNKAITIKPNLFGMIEFSPVGL
ncbi:MAG: hypothetical protein H0U50_09395 [Pyrinomonadaceae bacterium]|nr:hypothetical protein [Pyrinomonadaceae bacterium]